MVRKTQYLTVPNMDYHLHKSPHGSDTSLVATPRTQTPIFQQLYTTMTNWEKLVGPNALEFNKFKSLRNLHKKKKHFIKDAVDFSDVSSIDFSPKSKSKSFKIYTKRKAPRAPFKKSLSLGSVDKSTTSSSDEAYDNIVLPKSLSMNVVSSRPVSCPPGIIQLLHKLIFFFLSTKVFLTLSWLDQLEN